MSASSAPPFPRVNAYTPGMSTLSVLFAAPADPLQRCEPWPDFAPRFRRHATKGSDPSLAGSRGGPGDWLAPALASAQEPLARCVHDALPALVWRQNPTYRDAAFLARYAYCELVGP